MQDVPFQAAQIAAGAAQAQQRLRPERYDLDHVPCQPARADTAADRESLAHCDHRRFTPEAECHRTGLIKSKRCLVVRQAIHRMTVTLPRLSTSRAGGCNPVPRAESRHPSCGRNSPINYAENSGGPPRAAEIAKSARRNPSRSFVSAVPPLSSAPNFPGLAASTGRACPRPE